jgi:hypothetical protein
MPAEQTEFLNVDLDVVSRVSLEPLVAALGDRVIVLHIGREGRRHSAHLEAGGSAYKMDADRRVRRLVALVKSLPAAARALWNKAESREFNVGIQAGLRPRASEFRLRSETLAAVASVRGQVVITVYAPVGAPRAVQSRSGRPTSG